MTPTQKALAMADKWLQEYVDHTGMLRRPGSKLIEPGFVSSFRPYAADAEQPLWDDKTIKEIITDPGRRDMNEVLPPEKYVTDQHSTSACNGHAAAQAFTASRVLRGIKDDFVGSGAYVYSLINGGSDNGSNLEDGMRELMDKGVPDQKLVPYNMIYPRLQPKSARDAAALHKGVAAFRARTKQGLFSGLAAGYVGVCAVMAGRNFDNFNDGVAGLVPGRGNHACCLLDIRWRNGRFEMLLSNSWSIRWGFRGRVWILWDHLAQTFPYHVHYLLPASKEVIK